MTPRQTGDVELEKHGNVASKSDLLLLGLHGSAYAWGLQAGVAWGLRPGYSSPRGSQLFGELIDQSDWLRTLCEVRERQLMCVTLKFQIH